MKRILVIGDSWCSAVVAGVGDRMGWPLEMGIPEEMRQAVSGSTAMQWARDFDGRLTAAIDTPADVVVLSLLGNDMRQALADGTITVKEMRDGVFALRKVVRAVRRSRTIVLLYADPTGGADPRMAVAVEILNTVIRAALMFTGFRVEFVDTPHVVGAEHFRGGDNLHMLQSGHELLAKEITDLVEAYDGQ